MDSILKAKLKRLVEHADWEVIYAFQALIVDSWNKKELKGSNEFETVCNVMERDSKIFGLKEFLDSIERVALEE